MHVESNKTKTFRPLLLCMINTPHGLSEYTNIWVHPIKTFLWQYILRIPFFYIRPKNRLYFYTPCQVLVINLDKTSSMAKFSWSFVRWAMLQTVNWIILPKWNDAEHSTADNASSVPYYLQCHITRTYPTIFVFFFIQLKSFQLSKVLRRNRIRLMLQNVSPNLIVRSFNFVTNVPFNSMASRPKTHYEHRIDQYSLILMEHNKS